MEDHSIEHMCEHKLNCTTCTTRNIDSLQGVLLKTKQLVKQAITSHIFLNNIKSIVKNISHPFNRMVAIHTPAGLKSNWYFKYLNPGQIKIWK